MHQQKIKEFIKSIKNTDIEEIKYQNNEDFFYLKKSEVNIRTETNKVKKSEVINSTVKSSLTTIKSTMVGTFINLQNNKLPFVNEGDDIAIGQKIGQIEAMKIIKDIHSEVKGKILKILVSNGQAIEYGQELFLIDIIDIVNTN
ncbi:MAG: hypothetical protein LBH27_02360 [Endomicrobium sp.]|jgi:acetyl-CoA carboxylase biotin carboxyl carrier protein|nr:hypothetical protein [Endomicrobium sp.]